MIIISSKIMFMIKCCQQYQKQIGQFVQDSSFLIQCYRTHYLQCNMISFIILRGLDVLDYTKLPCPILNVEKRSR